MKNKYQEPDAVIVGPDGTYLRVFRGGGGVGEHRYWDFTDDLNWAWRCQSKGQLSARIAAIVGAAVTPLTDPSIASILADWARRARARRQRKLGNILGQTSPDPVGEMFGTGYQRFQRPDGLNGLAKESGSRLDVLAVVASKPGTGQFRTFIEEAKAAYGEVYVWEDWNPVVSAAMERYGFTRTQQIEEGELCTGWMWTAENLVEAAP